MLVNTYMHIDIHIHRSRVELSMNQKLLARRYFTTYVLSFRSVQIRSVQPITPSCQNGRKLNPLSLAEKGVKDTASPVRVFIFPSIFSFLSSTHKEIDIRSDIQNQREIFKDLDFRLLFLVFIWGVCMI